MLFCEINPIISSQTHYVKLDIEITSPSMLLIIKTRFQDTISGSAITDNMLC